MDDRDEELAEAVRELARTVEDLRAELEPRRRRRIRPPTPDELLRVTDEVAIPAALAVLRANVRALEAFQRGIELLRAEQAARDRTASAAAETGRRADQLRRTTVSQLDAALAALQRAASEGSIPADDRASDLLREARTLRDEVDRRLAEAAEEADAAGDAGAAEATRYTIEIEDDDDANRSNVDVEAELETLKDRYGADEDDGDEADVDATDGEEADGGSTDRGGPDEGSTGRDDDDGSTSRNGHDDGSDPDE